MKESRPTAVFGCMSTNEIVYIDNPLDSSTVFYTNDSTYVAGGKGINMARMIKTLKPKETVYFSSKTAKDEHNIWQYPLDALHDLNINTDYCEVLEDSPLQPNRVIALIERKTGKKTYIVLPGITDAFSPEDIERQEKLFTEVQKNSGLLVTSFEIPVETSLKAIEKANQKNIPVLVDMGGVFPDFSLDRLLKYSIFLLKPNRYETKILTGIDVHDEASARKAGEKLFRGGIQNVLITAGEQGGYLMNQNTFLPISAPVIENASHIRNGIGCGDQVMAAFCMRTLENDSVEEAAIKAIAAGTLQFYKDGINPVTPFEMEHLKLQS